MSVSDPAQPQILSEPEEMFSILSLRTSPPQSLYCPTQVKRPEPQISHSPPELLNSSPKSLTNESDSKIVTSSPISRSQSNLDNVFRSRKLKVDSDIVTNDNNKNKTQVGQKYQLQRQYSNKDIPEKLQKNNDNGIKHSASEVNINNIKTRPTSRKNSFSKPSRNSTSIPNVSRIPNPLVNKSNDNHIGSATKNDAYRSPETINSTTTHYHSIKSSESEQKPALVRIPVDKPVGLDLEEFLPVSIINKNKYFIVCYQIWLQTRDTHRNENIDANINFKHHCEILTSSCIA